MSTHGRLALALLLLASPALARTSTDLDVGWISRLPEIEYVVNSSNPRVEGWPAAGSDVTWRAHVRNWGSAPVTATYEWRLDGTLVAGGTTSLAANAYSEVDLVRPWSFERHQLTFHVHSGAAEESAANDELTVFTDALAVGFWVEQSFYNFMREHQQELSGVGSASFEDWAQRHITRYNEMAGIAIYPETPNGVLDRWRLQKIVVVPDGALPLVPFTAPDGNGSTHPDDSDRTIDMSWGFQAFGVPAFTDLHTVSSFNPFYLDGSRIHELGHARYLLDVYAAGVQHVPPRFRIDIEENGTPVVGKLMPAQLLISNGITGYRAYVTKYSGLMASDYTWIDEYSATALNLIAGARAVDGTANVPSNYAVFLNDLPAQNRVTIRDAAGKPVANAEVDLFRGERVDDDLSIPDSYLTRAYDNTPDLHFTSDSEGRILVGRNPFTPRSALDGNRLAELTAILRVRAGGKTTFGFLEAFDFNLAYWRGERDVAEYDVYTGTTCQSGSLRPNLSAPLDMTRVSSNLVTLRWQPVTDAESYSVWVSADGKPPVIIASHIVTTSTSALLGGNVRWWVEVHYGIGCFNRRSLTSAFSAPPLPDRRRAAGH
jgi:hypothetical protein